MSFYYPGMKTAGQKTERVVELIDIFPTLAELAGITPPENLEGESLKTLIDNPSVNWDNEAFIYEGNDVDKLQYSIVTDRYRYTCWADRATVKYELYDHTTDPGEYYNFVRDMTMEEIEQSPFVGIVADMEKRKKTPSNPNDLIVNIGKSG